MSWWLLLIPIALLWLIGGYIWLRGRRYRAAFHLDHVREFILGLGRVGQAALEKVDVPLVEGDDRVLVTSQGVALTYGVERRNELFVHRLMLRHLGGATTFPVARRFLALALLVYDPDGEADRIELTPERIFHVSWRVGQERQAELNARGYALPPGETDEQIRGLIAAADARAAGLLQGAPAPVDLPDPVDPAHPDT
ncbi:MAG: hypothetical protein R3266_15955 [Gemmatimonadota bacterium]|nr:hypothetical protein [Gemmatimonadota bacterium]